MLQRKKVLGKWIRENGAGSLRKASEMSKLTDDRKQTFPEEGGAGQRRTLLGRYKEGYGRNFKEPVTLVSWRTGGALGYTILCAHPVSSGVGSRGRRGLFGLRVEVCFWRIPGGFASES